MEKGYTIKSTFESDNADTIKKFLDNKSETPKIGGNGLHEMLKGLIHGLDQKSTRLDNPFTVLDDQDFDIKDPVVLDFVESFGPKKVVEVMALPKQEAHAVLCNLEKEWSTSDYQTKDILYVMHIWLCKILLINLTKQLNLKE